MFVISTTYFYHLKTIRSKENLISGNQYIHRYIIFKLSVFIISYFFSNSTYIYLTQFSLTQEKYFTSRFEKYHKRLIMVLYCSSQKSVVIANEKFSACLQSSVHFIILDLSGLRYRRSVWRIFSGFAFQKESNFDNTILVLIRAISAYLAIQIQLQLLTHTV
jgi:hypothetical protein